MLIFDLDGTVIDSKADITYCVNKTLESIGVKSLSPDQVELWIGVGVRPLFSQIFSNDPTLLQKSSKLFDHLYKTHLCDQTNVYSGIIEVFEHFANTPKVILSNKLQQYVDLIMAKLKLEKYFLAQYGREAFEKCKPDPTPIHAIASRFSSKKEFTWIVGDTTVDVKAGKAAGIKTCAVLYGYSDKESIVNEQPDKIVSHPTELLELLS